ESNGAKVKLVSVDGQPEAIKEILKPNSPFIATSAQFPRDQLRIALGIALARYWGATVPKTVPVKVKLIDRSNAAGFSW
ncbi:MAG: LacI family transcriptional regulator, partial [Serratia marcescens]|nr:LacI family transcriptional regulator [Serratia marcescens]